MQETNTQVHVDAPIEYPRSTIFNVVGWVASDKPVQQISIGERIAKRYRRPDVENVHCDKNHVHGFIIRARVEDIEDNAISISIDGRLNHQHKLAENNMLEMSVQEKLAKLAELFPGVDGKELMSASRELEIENESLLKVEWLEKIFKQETSEFQFDGKTYNFLSESLKATYNISDNPIPASRAHDPLAVSLIAKYSSGKILDCGSGFPLQNYKNVVNFEIQKYANTDIIGVGEELPFKDNVFDGVFTFSVLEHVKNPFKCAQEIQRVLKPGGVLYASVPFLQPIHAYPHHYYNMTNQGLRQLFEGLEVVTSGVPNQWSPRV